MTLIEKYIDCMQRGDCAALADLFTDRGILHDSSLVKVGQDTLHLEGKMAIEMMFHHKFGFNGGPFSMTGIRYKEDRIAWYFISYGGRVVSVTAMISEMEDGKIKRLNIYPL